MKPPKPPSPPRPRVGLKTLERVLNRHTAFKSPEARLVVAVITVAIGDCLSASPTLRAEARRFIEGPRLEIWADHVGLEHAFVRAIAREAGYFATPRPRSPAASHAPAKFPEKELTHA